MIGGGAVGAGAVAAVVEIGVGTGTGAETAAGAGAGAGAERGDGDGDGDGDRDGDATRLSSSARVSRMISPPSPTTSAPRPWRATARNARSVGMRCQVRPSSADVAMWPSRPTATSWPSASAAIRIERERGVGRRAREPHAVGRAPDEAVRTDHDPRPLRHGERREPRGRAGRDGDDLLATMAPQHAVAREDRDLVGQRVHRRQIRRRAEVDAHRPAVDQPRREAAVADDPHRAVARARETAQAAARAAVDRAPRRAAIARHRQLAVIPARPHRVARAEHAAHVDPRRRAPLEHAPVLRREHRGVRRHDHVAGRVERRHAPEPVAAVVQHGEDQLRSHAGIVAQSAIASHGGAQPMFVSISSISSFACWHCSAASSR